MFWTISHPFFQQITCRRVSPPALFKAPDHGLLEHQPRCARPDFVSTWQNPQGNSCICGLHNSSKEFGRGRSFQTFTLLANNRNALEGQKTLKRLSCSGRTALGATATAAEGRASGSSAASPPSAAGARRARWRRAGAGQGPDAADKPAGDCRARRGHKRRG